MDTIYYYNITPNQDNWDLFYKVVFPIVTLVFGALLAFGLQGLSELLRLRKVKKYLIHSIEDLILAIEAQIKHLETFIAGIKGDNHDVPFLTIESGFHTRSIETVSRYDTFRIIVLKGVSNKNKKRKVLNNYNNAIEIIKVIEQHSKDEINALIKSDGQDKHLYNDYFWKLQNLINSKIKIYNERKSKERLIFTEQPGAEKIQKENELAEDILEVWNTYNNLSAGSKTIFQHEKFLVVPLTVLAKKFNDFELLGILPQMINLLNEFKQTRKSFTTRFEMYKDNLKKAKIYFKETVQILK